MESKKSQLFPTNQELGNTGSHVILHEKAKGSPTKPEAYTFTIAFADPIPIKLLGSRLRGNFNLLKWTRPEQIASRMKSLIEECFPESSVKLEAELEAQDGQLGSGLVVEVENGDPSKIEPIAFSFAKRIKGGQPEQVDFFVEYPEEFQDIVCKHVDEFLGTHGNLNIGAPLSIQGGKLNLQIAGKFEPPPSHLPSKYDPIRFKGMVDGFQKSDRIVHLISVEGVRFQAQFDLQFLLGQVGAAAMDDILVEISLQPKENAKGRLVNELTEIRTCPQEQNTNMC